MSSYNSFCCCESGGGGGPTPPSSLTTPLQLQVEDNRVYSSGTLGQPEIFKYDIISHNSSAAEFGGPPTPYSYSASSGLIIINRPGTYRVTMTFTVQIEAETNPESKVVIFFVKGNVNTGPPSEIIMQLTFRASGQDLTNTYTASKIITVTSPTLYTTAIDVIDPNPTESILVLGQSFVPGNLSYINIQYINDNQFLPLDVRPII